MVETLSEGRPLQNLDLESSRNNYSPGADCFDIPDLKMKKVKECSSSVLMLEGVRPSQVVTKVRLEKGSSGEALTLN